MGNIALESGRSWNGVGQPLMAWYPSSLRGGKEGGWEEEGPGVVKGWGGMGTEGETGLEGAGPRGEEGGAEGREVWLQGWGSG